MIAVTHGRDRVANSRKYQRFGAVLRDRLAGIEPRDECVLVRNTCVTETTIGNVDGVCRPPGG